MKIELEKLIEIVTREVIKELVKLGYNAEEMLSSVYPEGKKAEKKQVEIDMSGFKTPVLTEGQIEMLEKGVEEILIPPQTIVTPGATRLIKQYKIKLIYKS